MSLEEKEFSETYEITEICSYLRRHFKRFISLHIHGISDAFMKTFRDCQVVFANLNQKSGIIFKAGYADRNCFLIKS